MRRGIAIAISAGTILVPTTSFATEGAASVYQGRRHAKGVEAVVRTYRQAPPINSKESGPPTTSHGESSGPALVPLVGQVLCGHDPTIPGGLTCVLPPPPRPEIADIRRRPRPPSPDEVARRLADRAISLAPQPRLRLAPARRGLTGLPSFFWLAERPRPIEARAGVGGLTVTAQARPVQFIWDFGDGTDLATRDSGRRWTKARQGSIKHTYEGKSRYSVEVEVIWEARWRLGRGGWRSLGYFSNSDTRPYRVRSLISVLVKPR
ncbi:MAG TPA: hypothetical protein VNA87_05130 [Actinomycetota bacterium]|nr:hypothetical protein [Actinomycetota bacterium]